MGLAIGALLIHDEGIAAEARAAVQAAYDAPADARHALLESAAKLVFATTENVDCSDVREIFGLS